MAYDPKAYPLTVLRARQGLVGPGGLADNTVIELYALLGQTLDIIAKEGDSGLLTAERAERLRRSIMEELVNLGTEYAGALDTATLETSKAVAALHEKATASAFASIGAEGAKEVATAAASYTKVPGLTLQHMMARRSLGGASTYQGLVSRGLGEMADAVDHTLIRGVARGISSRRATLELAAQFAGGDKAILQYVTDGKLRSAALRGFDDSMPAQTAKDLLQYGRMIAVSEINEAHRSAHILSAVRSPVVGTAQWTRSGRHAGLKSSPCECDILASTDRHGLGVGIYFLQDYPAAPHPHCACYPYLITRPPKEWGTPPPAPSGAPKAIAPKETRELFEELAAKYPSARNVTDGLVKSATKTTNRHLGLAYEVYQKGEKAILAEQKKIATEVRAAVTGSRTKVRLDGLGAGLEGALKLESPQKAAERLQRIETKALTIAEDPDTGAALTKRAKSLASEAKLRWAEIVSATADDVAGAKEAAKALAALQRSPAGKAKKAEAAADALRKAETPDFPNSADDVTVLKKLGGTTGAELVEDANGRKYVRKTGTSPGHLREEVYADRAYEALGVDVPPQRLYNAEISAADGSSGGPVKLAQYFDDTTELGALASEGGKAFDNAAARLRENFVADALLANWDVLGLDLDNVLRVNSGPWAGRLLRIDNGGALRYRAQGKLKGDAFGPIVGELDTLRDPKVNPQAAKVFSGLTDEAIENQIVEVLSRRDALLAALPEDLHDIMRKRLKSLEERLPAAKRAQLQAQAPQASASRAAGGAVSDAKKAAAGRSKIAKELEKDIEARLDAHKGNVAGLKKTIAHAEAAQKKAKAAGNPALQAKAEVLVAKAKKALADKQLANKKSSKKYAAKQKLKAVGEVVDPDNPAAASVADLEAAVEKAASALDDALFAGADSLAKQAKQAKKLAEETLDALQGLGKEIIDEAGALATAVEDNLQNVSKLKGLITDAEKLASKADDLGSPQALFAADDVLKKATSALADKQTANKVSSTKYAVKTALQKADDAAAAGKAASAQKHLGAAEKKLAFLEKYTDTDFAVSKKEIGSFSQKAAAVQKKIDASETAGGGKGASAAKEATAAKKATKEAASEATKQGDTPTPPDLSDLTAAEKKLLGNFEDNVHWAKINASKYYTDQTIGGLQAAIDKAGSVENAQLKNYIRTLGPQLIEKVQIKSRALDGKDVTGAKMTKNRAFVELGEAFQKKAKQLNSQSDLKKQIGYADAALTSAKAAGASPAAKKALTKAVDALEKKLQSVAPKDIPASKIKPKGSKSDPTWDVPAGYTHYGSKAAVDNWGADQFATWTGKVKDAPQEYKGVKYYKGSGYDPINRWLRGLDTPAPHRRKELREYVVGVEKALSRKEARIDEDMMTYRGLQYDKWYNDGEALVGELIKDEGILSTSPSREFAYSWGDRKSAPILMEIEMPEGTRGAYIERIWNRREYEVLLDRGAVFEVKEVRYEKKSYGDPFMVMRVRFVEYAPTTDIDD